jgi:HEAT repeat protein
MSLREKTVDVLIRMLKNGDTPARGYSAMALGESRDTAAIEPLIERLTIDTDPDVRGEAAVSLGKILTPNSELRTPNSKGAVDTLITSLKDDDAFVRINSAAALGMIKDSSAVEPLIETLKSDDFITYPFGSELSGNYQDDVRDKAIESLGEIGDSSAAGSLISILGNGFNDDPSIIFSTLGKFRDDRTIKFLIGKTQDDDPSIRRIAIRALENNAENPVVTDALINLLLDSSSGVKIASAKALSNLLHLPSGDRDGVRGRILVPLALLLRDRDKEVRKEIAKIVAKIAGDRAIEHIISLLSDDDADVRRTAVELLGNRGNKKVAENLIQLLDDEDAVVVEVINALKKLKASNAFAPLLPLIKNREIAREVRCCAIHAAPHLFEDIELAEKNLIDMLQLDEDIKPYVIYSLGSIGCIGAIKDFLSCENKEIKRTAIKAIGAAKTPDAVELLINLLNTENDRDTICDVISALCNIGDARAIEPLISPHLIKNDDPAIRKQCVMALGMLCKGQGTRLAPASFKQGDERVTDSLISALKDEDPAIRREAIISLGNAGDTKAIEPLISALFDPERFMTVRTDIAMSLKKIGDTETAVNRLLDVLNDGSLSQYHWIAAEAIGKIYERA